MLNITGLAFSFIECFLLCFSAEPGGIAMDYIREFDIRLEKEMYYAGETLSGHVILDTVENFKLKGNKFSCNIFKPSHDIRNQVFPVTNF